MRTFPLAHAELTKLRLGTILGGPLVIRGERVIDVVTYVEHHQKQAGYVITGWPPSGGAKVNVFVRARTREERAEQKVEQRVEEAHMKWTEDETIVAYCVASYMGVEINAARTWERVFMWTERGHIYSGNTRAFYEHLDRAFHVGLTAYGHAAINLMLRASGFPARPHELHGKRAGGKVYQPQEPRVEDLGGIAVCVDCHKEMYIDGTRCPECWALEEDRLAELAALREIKLNEREGT
jgi:hypothetical protein